MIVRLDQSHAVTNILMFETRIYVSFYFQAKHFQNQPYDEALEVPDGEEVASTYSPTPRVHHPSGMISFKNI